MDVTRFTKIGVDTDYKKQVNGITKRYQGDTSGTYDYVKDALEDGDLKVDSRLDIMPTIYTFENIWD